MSRKVRVVSLFRERFVNRDDCFAIQLPDGTYSLVRETLTDEVICRHLHGDMTLGLYPSSGSISKWLCIDIDTTVAQATLLVQERLNSLCVPFLTEFSGRKGFHIWIFFSQPVPNDLVRRFGHTITSGHEVFPKQDQVSLDGYGNLIKAPLSRHQVTGRWCLFVDEDLTQLDEPYQVLASVKTISPETVRSVGSHQGTRSLNQAGHLNKGLLDLPPLLKDCVQVALRTGCEPVLFTHVKTAMDIVASK